MPKVSIAVQSYKNPEMLSLCLRSVQEHCAHFDYELIVADCATEEDTIMMMREDFPQTVFLPHKENVGFGAMVNACIDHAHGEYVFFINADTILEKDTVVKFISFMDVHTNIGLCGPRQKNFNGKYENTRFRFYQPMTILYRRTFLGKFGFAKKHLNRFEMKDVKKSEPYPVEWVIGSAMFVRRSMMEKVGKMDSRFFMYMEDVDWCRRFWEKGFIVCYNPQITMYHFYGKGSAKGGILRSLLFNRLTWVHIASGIKYFKKYKDRPKPHIAKKI
jgi:N-acetylglucosaminyl-diphospho-decaprenol L-rhamnosyltransferase